VLDLGSLGKGAAALAQCRGKSCDPFRHGGVVHFGRRLACRCGLGRRGQDVFHRFPPVRQRFAERSKFVHLLNREGEPRLQVGIEIGLLIEIDWDMKQRTGRRDLNLAGASPGDNWL
jgi:hypothetical protein